MEIKCLSHNPFRHYTIVEFEGREYDLYNNETYFFGELEKGSVETLDKEMRLKLIPRRIKK